MVRSGGGQVGGGGVGDLDEELFAYRAEKPFDLAPTLRSMRCRMNKADSEFRARPEQPGINERRSVVNIHRLRHTAGSERGLQRHPEPDDVLRVTEPVTGDQPGYR